MFAWVFNLFRRANVDKVDVYAPRERIIYEYFDGEKRVKADPMILYKRIAEKKPDIIIDGKLARSIHSEAVIGHNKLMGTYRYIFNVKCLDEGGLSEPELANLFDHFLLYCETVKKNSSQSQTLSNNSEDFTSSSEKSRPIANSSDSGSTGNESSSVGPASLPLA